MTSITGEFPAKPHTVTRAELALWLWTAWISLFGIYQSWAEIPEIEKAMTDQLQGMIAIDPQTMLSFILAGYGLLAALSAWVIWKIGAGRNWARSSLLWGFVLEVIFAACPPYHDRLMDYATDIPDYGLQIYALYLLYTKPGSGWFRRVKG